MCINYFGVCKWQHHRVSEGTLSFTCFVDAMVGENNNSNVNVLCVLREMYYSCGGIYTLILLCPDCLFYCVLPFSLTLTQVIGVCFYLLLSLPWHLPWSLWCHLTFCHLTVQPVQSIHVIWHLWSITLFMLACKISPFLFSKNCLSWVWCPFHFGVLEDLGSSPVHHYKLTIFSPRQVA